MGTTEEPFQVADPNEFRKALAESKLNKATKVCAFERVLRLAKFCNSCAFGAYRYLCLGFPL